MDSFVVTRLFFFFVFLATAIYWIVSFSHHNNIIYKLPRAHRWPYMLGLMWIEVSALNIYFSKAFSFFHLNMFLVGAIIVMGVVAFWDKKISSYYNSPYAEEN
jgi:hypothetical protein